MQKKTLAYYCTLNDRANLILPAIEHHVIGIQKRDFPVFLSSPGVYLRKNIFNWSLKVVRGKTMNL
jgi:hypothetical protein